MSNLVYIIPTEFKDLSDGSVEQGVRVYDDYDDVFETFDGQMPTDDLEILKTALCGSSKPLRNLLDYLEESQTGVEIGSTYYEWEEIAPVFEGLVSCSWCNLSFDKEGAAHRDSEPVCSVCLANLERA